MKKAHIEHFERFEEHTLLKHAVLRRYLRTWARKLLFWNGRDFDRIWIVDGFAGAGSDKAGNPGSPLIAAQIAKEVEGAVANHSSARPGRVMVLAIERASAIFETLKACMGPYTDGDDPTVLLRLGTLAERIDNFAGFVGNEPVLYFLDPFGVDGLDRRLLTRALAGPRNEVLVLFSDLGVARLMAALDKDARVVEDEIADILAQPGLFASIDEELVAAKRFEIERSNSGLRHTQSAADRIIVDAIGKEGRDALRGLPWERRQDEAVRIWKEALEEEGATHILIMPVRNIKGQRIHCLVHASKHWKAFVAMKEAMDASIGQSLLPGRVRDAIALELAADSAGLLDAVLQRFGGTTSKWTQSGGIKEFLLKETPAFPRQITELRNEMDHRGLRVGSRPFTYKIPPRLDD